MTEPCAPGFVASAQIVQLFADTGAPDVDLSDPRAVEAELRRQIGSAVLAISLEYDRLAVSGPELRETADYLRDIAAGLVEVQGYWTSIGRAGPV